MKLDSTPGPWIHESTDETENGLDEFIKDGKSHSVAWAYSKSNARLIAAAPEMLGFLIEGIRRCENTWIEMWGENPDDDLDATEAEIRAACRSHEINAKQIAIIECATGHTWEELNGTI